MNERKERERERGREKVKKREGVNQRKEERKGGIEKE